METVDDNLPPRTVIHTGKVLQLRLAIQFGSPVNHLQNRFLIGTTCNLGKYRLFCPRSPIARAIPPFLLI